MHGNATNTVKRPSLVETIGTGFRTLNRSLAVLLVPLALDLWYWLGPRISLRPFAAWLRALNPETWELLRQQLEAALPPDRAFDLRIRGLIPFWQRIYTLDLPDAAVRPITRGTWYIGEFLTLFGAIVALNAFLLLLMAMYLLPLAEAVGSNAIQGSWPMRVFRVWLRMAGIMVVVLTLLTVAGVPLMTLAGVMIQLVPGVGYFIASLVFVSALWFIFTTSFAYDAVVLNGVGPLRALLASFIFVQRSFWGAVGLFLINIFILQGLGVIWQSLDGTVVGLLIAMLSSAYVGAGLAAAHLVFYYDRLPVVEAAIRRT